MWGWGLAYDHLKSSTHKFCLFFTSDETSPAGHAAPPIAPMDLGEGEEEGERMMERKEEEEEGEAVVAGDSQLPSTQDLFGGDSS